MMEEGTDRAKDLFGSSTPILQSTKIQPNPASKESALQDASEKHLIVSNPMIGPIGDEGKVCTFVWWNWASIHSFAETIACEIISKLEKSFCSKIFLFLVVQIAHIIQGKRRPFPIPIGGRQVRRFDDSRPSRNDWIRDELSVDLNGACSQTCWTKGQRKKTWRQVSSPPQWGQDASGLIPLAFKFSPIGRAFFNAFQRRNLTLGEHCLFQTSLFQLKHVRVPASTIVGDTLEEATWYPVFALDVYNLHVFSVHSSSLWVQFRIIHHCFISFLIILAYFAWLG